MTVLNVNLYIMQITIAKTDDFYYELLHMNTLPATTQKRIALLVPSLLGGGSEKVIITISHALASAGIEVHLLVLEQGQDYYVNDHVVVHALSSLQGNKSKTIGRKRYLYMPGQTYRLLQYLKQHKITTVLSFQQRANLLNIALKAIYPHKAFTNIRTTLSKAYRKNGFFPRMKYISNKLLNFSNMIICNSKGVENDLIINFKILTE